jgi:hypothetical protein
MEVAAEFLKQGKTKELWERCCGFIDLNMDQFMTIQHQLLLEQIELLKNCELGKKAMRGAQPSSVEEFRQQVPITTYSDYAPYLLEKREDVLPEKPVLWQCTSGRSGEYAHKWAPITRRMYDEIGDFMVALALFASCEERGDVNIEEHDKLIYGVAPPPYASGSYFRAFAELNIFDMLPPLEEAEKMGFEERIEKGFMMALSEGMDVMGAISSVLVTIGERLGQGSGIKRAAALIKKPKVLLRMLKAVAKSKLAGRPLLPRDLWSLKALVACGTDNVIYREKIKYLWGRYPMDTYGSCESNLIATQTWDYDAMTFLPHINFLEFMPEREWNNWLMDKTYRADLLLLDEVQAGETYAVVVTNFLGGAFVRYFIGDAIKIKSLRNEKCNISIPQMLFDSRMDGIIDIAGFTRLTEKVVWEAIENSALVYQDWSIRKESAEEKPVLHLYIEPKQGTELTEDQVAASIHEQLKRLDSDYASLETMLDLNPLKVTVLPHGTFQAYIARQRAAGADLAHLKPPHVNPTEAQIDALLTPVT